MARDYFDSLDRKVLAVLGGLFERGGSPERISRGIAAGILGICFPSNVLRVPVAILAAFFFRGNKFISILVPLIALLFDLQFISHFENDFASLIWSSGTVRVNAAFAALKAADASWNWLHMIASVLSQLSIVASFRGGLAVMLVLTALVTGLALGAAIYPISLFSLSFFYDAKLRAQHYMEWSKRRPAEPFVLPKVPERRTDVSLEELRAQYCGKKYEFFKCDSVRLLIDGGQAYPEMLAAIASAHKTLVLETYILRDDKFGRLFAEALKVAAGRGVKTRVLCDGVGSLELPADYKMGLVRAGVELRIYHPLLSFLHHGFGFLQRRDHRKIIVADSHVSLIGGLNIADEYAAVEDGGGGWRDTHIRIDGEAAAKALTRIFEETWRKAERVTAKTKHVEMPKKDTYTLPPPSNEEWPKERTPPACTSADLVMVVLSNRELIMRMRIKRAYLKAFKAAKHYILIENAFFIPDRDVLRALYAAVKRGVKVTIVVAMKHDVRIAAMAARALYDELLSHGVRLYEYPISMIHSKVAAIDDCWSIVSSYNLNHRSLLHDLEVGALFFDHCFTCALRDQIIKDIAKCKELSKEMHRARPWNIALTESVCYQFRYWL